ncbi:glycosyltransferase [Oceanicoccus sagamiensis]|uniref:Glycosyltransferase n=1 Tax=Oceanicoccus sagamiensis TaxID=716816 RepID=A0A1X9N8Y4_9GAMM|nr:glycosyltransferase [Oceanicoccus sagamiensis]ARN74520.1 hypothetical protein BST96_10550 [Oceanicoccus sagamiensis]
MPHNNNKKVLHLIDSGGVYGAEKVILNLSQHMRSNQEFTPIIGCIVNSEQDNNDLYDAALALNIDAIKVPIRNTLIAYDALLAGKAFQRSGIDIIHSHGYKPSVLAFFISLFTDIAITATCHLWFNPNQGPIKMRVMVALEKQFYKHRNFSYIIGVSEEIGEELSSKGIATEKIKIIKNGINIADFAKQKKDGDLLRKALNISDSDIVVSNIARLTQQKSQSTLLEAAALLRHQGHPVELLIVGEGELKEDLLAQADHLAISEHVHFLGFRDDIPALLNISTAFAMPSIDEGMPISLLEAAAAKTPIITTQVGDIGKLIVDNDSGLIIDIDKPQQLADKILTVALDTSGKISQFTDKAYQMMEEHYSARAMTDNYQTLYRTLLDLRPNNHE